MGPYQFSQYGPCGDGCRVSSSQEASREKPLVTGYVVLGFWAGPPMLPCWSLMIASRPEKGTVNSEKRALEMALKKS